MLAGMAQAGANQWTSIGPSGAHVFALAVDPDTPGTLYAGTADGLFKSEDSGMNWTAADLNGVSVGDLAVDPRSKVTVYAVTSAAILTSFVQKSVDGGAHSVPGIHRLSLTNESRFGYQFPYHALCGIRKLFPFL